MASAVPGTQFNNASFARSVVADNRYLGAFQCAA